MTRIQDAIRPFECKQGSHGSNLTKRYSRACLYSRLVGSTQLIYNDVSPASS